MFGERCSNIESDNSQYQFETECLKSDCIRIISNRFPLPLLCDLQSFSPTAHEKLYLYGGLGSARTEGRRIISELELSEQPIVESDPNGWLDFFARIGRVDLLLREIKEGQIIDRVIDEDSPLVATVASDMIQQDSLVQVSPVDKLINFAGSSRGQALNRLGGILPVAPGAGHIPIDLDPPSWSLASQFLGPIGLNRWRDILVVGGDLSLGLLDSISYLAPFAERFTFLDAFSWSMGGKSPEQTFLPADERWLLNLSADGVCDANVQELLIGKYDQSLLRDYRELEYQELSRHFDSLSLALGRRLEFEVRY